MNFRMCVVYCCGSVVTVVFHCARLSCTLLVRDATTLCARSWDFKVGRVAGGDVVEDGLTEDVPSSMLDKQRLGGQLYVVRGKTVLGKRPNGTERWVRGGHHPVSAYSCMEQWREKSPENGE